MLIIDLHAHFHSDSALYPDSSFQSDSGLSQGGTDSGLHLHSCLHPDSGSYPAVRVKFYAYVNMLGRNDLKLSICWKGKQSATTRREETNAGTTQMTALVKGSKKC